jgi:hypothetical protein
MSRYDPVGDVTPFDDLAGNRCCVCERAIGRTTAQRPNYFCIGCYQLWCSAFEAREPWLWALYLAESGRRKRRMRRLKAGVLPPRSLDRLIQAAVL